MVVQIKGHFDILQTFSETRQVLGFRQTGDKPVSDYASSTPIILQ